MRNIRLEDYHLMRLQGIDFIIYKILPVARYQKVDFIILVIMRKSHPLGGFYIFVINVKAGFYLIFVIEYGEIFQRFAPPFCNRIIT